MATTTIVFTGRVFLVVEGTPAEVKYFVSGPEIFCFLRYETTSAVPLLRSHALDGMVVAGDCRAEAHS